MRNEGAWENEQRRGVVSRKSKKVDEGVDGGK